MNYTDSITRIRNILPDTYRFKMHDRVVWTCARNLEHRGSIIGYPGRASFAPECSLVEDGSHDGLSCVSESLLRFEDPLVELAGTLENA